MAKRKTDEEFKQEVYDLVGSEYTFLESYVNSATKLRIKHNKCGNIYEVTPNSFLRGNRCPYCAGLVKKTDKQFKQEVYGLVGNEYTFLDSYVNNATKLKVKHNKCGNIYEVTPNSFLEGHGCPYCGGTHKKTDKEFKQEVYDLVGNEYTFLDKYVNNNAKIKVKHNKCGNIYEVIPRNFLSGSRCPYCNGANRTDKEFKQEVYNLVGDTYTFLDKYVNNHTKLRVRHNECGNIYEVRPYSFLEGCRCPYCSAKDKSKTDAQFKQEVYKLVGNEYTFLEPYANSYTKVKVKHIKCGNIYNVKPTTFLQGKRCPYCSSKAKKTDEDFKQEIYNLVDNEYSFLEHYQGALTKIKVKHNKCDNTYEVTPHDFIEGNRCPFCTNTPKGELIILKILDNLGINYEYQKTFDDLVDKSCLSYDFYLPDQNILIEYQGLQHYQPIDYFGGETKFKNQQKHDLMKLDYAKNNGYNLIAVPYTADTFSKIKKYLVKHGLKK